MIAKVLLCLSLVSAWMAPALLLAQSSSGGGTIQGVVKDVSGAVVVAAKVTVLHVETGVVTPTVTNTNGYFLTPSLPIGKYTVRIESPGMSAWVGELLLELGKIAEVSPVLSPGSVSETVVVNDAAPLVTTADPTEASVLESRRIAELPTDGRNPMTLIADTTPGVEAAGTDVLYIAGMARHATNFMQDGAASNNVELGGSSNMQGLESMGEVRVETSASSARYRSPASVIVSTKSGGNRVHGSLYETARNNAIGVARAREDVNRDGTPYKLPKLIRNEFGGSISGPVFLPSFGINGKRFYDGRNRTFFFFSREFMELRQAITYVFAVPTPAMRNGDFSGALDSQGRKYTIYDALSTRQVTLANGLVVSARDPFPNNQLGTARMSPLAKRIYAMTPAPNDITNPLVGGNLRMAVPTSSYGNVTYRPATLRLDHRFTERDNTFIKVNGGTQIRNMMGTNYTTNAPTLGNEANMSYRVVRARAAVVNWTHVFTPGFFVETSANRMWQRNSMSTGPVGKNWSAELGLPNPWGDVGWPNITGTSFMNYVEGDDRRYVRSNITNLEQNYSWIRGTHNIQFGATFQNDLEYLMPDAGTISGAAAFSNIPTALQNSAVSSTASPTAVSLTGLAAASLYLGYADTYTVRQHRPLMRTTQNRYGIYLQDSYKMTARLTLIPGFRWDMTPAVTEAHDLLSAFDLKSHSIMLPRPLDYYYGVGASSAKVVALYNKVGVTFTSAEELGRDPHFLPTNMYDIGPRLGFAYRLFGGNRQVVLRGGYGLYFSGIPLRTLLNGTSVLPFATNYSYNPNSASQSPDGISNYLLRSTPTIVAGVNSGICLPG